MTFLFRLDVCAWGGGGDEGFSHSVCVSVPVCAHMHKLNCVRAQTIKAYTYSSFFVAFVLVYSIVQMASDLSTGHPLFSVIFYFLFIVIL